MLWPRRRKKKIRLEFKHSFFAPKKGKSVHQKQCKFKNQHRENADKTVLQIKYCAPALTVRRYNAFVPGRPRQAPADAV